MRIYFKKYTFIAKLNENMWKYYLDSKYYIVENVLKIGSPLIKIYALDFFLE